MSSKRFSNSEVECNSSKKKLKIEIPPFSSNDFLNDIVIGDKSA